MCLQISEGEPLRFKFFSSDDLGLAADWRPDYFFSPGAELPRLGRVWPVLSDLKVDLLDGWRFSDSPESDWYLRNIELRDTKARDKNTGEYQRLRVGEKERVQAEQFRVVIEGERFYRMRHVHAMKLACEAQHFERPGFSDSSICVAPGDVVVRRVGKVEAAMVSSFHRCHPVDANLAIIRGLNSHQSVWLAYCLNQPLYKHFLEEQQSAASVVRVGLKRLGSMPIAPCPAEFVPLAEQFLQAYEAYFGAEDALSALRGSVQNWLTQRLPAEELTAKPVPRFFKARDLDHRLNYQSAEQAYIANQLLENHQCLPLTKLADLSTDSDPNSGASGEDLTDCPVVKIGSLDGQQSFQLPKREAETLWRVHKRPLRCFDVLLSTFSQEPKVAMVSHEPDSSILVSEQLGVLQFHRTPGAYALLLETPFIRQQINRLATGTVQRFVQPRMLKKLILPPIEDVLAKQWHRQLLDLLEAKASADKKLKKLSEKMFLVYRQIHPVMDVQNVSSNAFDQGDRVNG